MTKLESYGQMKDGKLSIVKRDKFTQAIKTLPDGRYKVMIEKLYRKRSNPQNAYLWGVVYNEMIGGFQNVGYTEIKTAEDVHNFCRLHFYTKDVYNENTGQMWKTIQSTTEFTTIEFNDKLKELSEFALEFLGVTIPEPNEIMEELKL